MAFFPTNAAQVQTFATALYGVQVGSTTMTQVTSDIQAAGGLNNALNAYYTASFGTATTASVAQTIATNVGLGTDTNAVAFITAQLNAAAPAARGAAVIAMLDNFLNTTSGTYAAAAAAFNTTIASAVAYTGTSDVTSGSTIGGGQTFTLTTGTDTLTGTAGNDSFTATGTTFTAYDSIDGGAGTDTFTLSDTAGALAAAAPTGVKLTSFEKMVVTSTGTVGISDAVTSATATKQIVKITTGAAVNSVDTYTVTYGGSSNAATSAASDSSATKPEAAALIAGAVNALAGATIAQVVGDDVIVTAPVAGVALPAITVVSKTSGTADTTNRAAVSTLQANVTAATAATAVAFDVSGSGYTGITSVNVSSAGGASVKASALQDVVLTNATGNTILVDGGKTAAITTTGTSAVTSRGAALTSVSVKGGTGATVNNFKTANATDDNQGLTLTSVTLDTVNGNSTVGGQALTNLTVTGAVATARTVTVTNALTSGHALNLTVSNTGYTTSALTTEAQTVVTDANATSLNVVSNGTKSSVDLSNNTAATSISISGAAALKANVGAGSVLKVDGSSATGNLSLGDLAAATRTVKTGSGNDSFAIQATATVSADAGAGNDTVTLKSTVAAGSTINLGAGNDKLLSSSGSIATGLNATTGVATVIDGGDGIDGIAASLITAGTATLVKGFETLILDNTSGTADATIVTGLTGLELASAGGGTYTGITTSQSLAVTNTAANTATTTLTFTGVTGTADSYAINFNASTPTGTTAEPTSANVLAAKLSFGGIENVTIDSSGAAYTWNSAQLLDDSELRTVTITGAKNLDLTIGGSSHGVGSTSTPATGLSLVDGSAATGKLAIVLDTYTAATAGLTVKTGSGADTITTAAKPVTLTLGAGPDTVLAAASTVTVSSAPATATEAVASLVTITDIASSDKIDFSTSTSTAAYSLGAAVDVSSATTLLAALNALANSTQAQTTWAVYGGNTYLVWDASSSTTAGISSSDVVVKLSGVVDLTSSTVDANDTLTIV